MGGRLRSKKCELNPNAESIFGRKLHPRTTMQLGAKILPKLIRESKAPITWIYPVVPVIVGKSWHKKIVGKAERRNIKKVSHARKTLWQNSGDKRLNLKEMQQGGTFIPKSHTMILKSGAKRDLLIWTEKWCVLVIIREYNALTQHVWEKSL